MSCFGHTPAKCSNSVHFFGFFGALKRTDFFGVHTKKVGPPPWRAQKTPDRRKISIRPPLFRLGPEILALTAKKSGTRVRELNLSMYNRASEEFCAGSELLA